MLRAELILGGLLIATLFSGGCSGTNEDSPKTAPVTGLITYQGKSVTSGLITFHPTNGTKQASAQINGQGGFTLSTFEREDGAVFGVHKVTIKVFPEDQDVSVIPEKEIKYLVPRKYIDEETTPLEVEVKEESNNFTFELED